MAGLGDLLELLYGAYDRFETVRLTARNWQHVAGSRRAFERFAAGSGGTSFGAVKVGEPQFATREGTVRLWFEKPHRVREEREGELGGAALGIRDGGRWWMYSPDFGARSNEDAPEVGSGVGQQYEHFLDPSSLIPALAFELCDETMLAGRRALRVLARPRGEGPDLRHTLFRLAAGADGYELAVDGERGVLLRALARFDGEPFSLHEVMEIAFDEPFGSETFVFVPPHGEVVRGARGSAPSRMTIEEAVAAAPFRVFVPRVVGPGWRMTVHFFAGEERPASPPTVTIHYARDDASHQLNITQAAIDARDPSMASTGTSPIVAVRAGGPGSRFATATRCRLGFRSSGTGRGSQSRRVTRISSG